LAVSSEALWQLGPETLVAIAAVVVYVAGAFSAPRASWSWVGLAGLGAAALCLASTAPQAAEPLRIDGLALWLRWFALASGALLILTSWRPAADADGAELLGSLLLIIAGMMLVAAAGDLVLLFLGLELISIPTYIVLFVGRRTVEGREAAAKYFYLSILASAILLFGLSFLYGAAGTTSIEAIHQRLLDGGGSLGGFAGLALVFIFAGLSYKIAAVPFHFYAPDVYQGTTNDGAALLSVAPKAAGFLALVRLVAVAAEGVSSDAWRIALALAVLTMTTGNLLALWQDNLRRLLAYSSIAHAGYMLIGLAVYLGGNTLAGAAFDGVAALLFYLLLYALATVGTFAALNYLGETGQPVDHVDQLAGLAWSEEPRSRATAWLIAAFMFSLTGIPPLAGFWGKLALFAGALGVRGTEPAMRSWFVGLAILGIANAAIAAAYYLRVVGAMFFRMPMGKPRTGGSRSAPFAAAVICALLVVAIGLIPTPWYEAADRATPAAAAREGPEMVADDR
jgi:NADH-quinone oxidoreductase subunit N